MNDTTSGWLLVDKPPGWTSFDAVNKVRRVLALDLGRKPRSIKVGHSGTLDPMATGLLVLAVGRMTKLIQQQMKADKTYEATFILGTNSSTGDAEGELTPVSDRVPTESELTKVIAAMTGEIEQIPPKYSALKIDGVAAYERARKGEDFTIELRRIMIYSAQMTRYQYPEADLICTVSSGTYIRTLVEDYGKQLATGAYLSRLRRTAINELSVDAAISPQNIDAETIRQHLRPSLPGTTT